eukprot:scaffold1504_cov417-Prasinococcus_capsulatus_cf.AAC.25
MACGSTGEPQALKPTECKMQYERLRKRSGRRAVVTRACKRDAHPNSYRLAQELGAIDCEDFLRFCKRKGTTHADDPSDAAREYIVYRNIVPLFEKLAAALLLQQPAGEKRRDDYTVLLLWEHFTHGLPADPKAFVIDYLEALKQGSRMDLPITKDDLEVLFGLFDATGNGVLNEKQVSSALQLLGSSHTPPLRSCYTKASFVSLCSNALWHDSGPTD